MSMHHADQITVRPCGGRWVVDVPTGRGEELRIHLESHGIGSVLSRPEGTEEHLEVEDGIDPIALQAIVDEWER